MTVKNVAMNKKVRAAIYIRVSTEEQHLNGLSLPAQRQALTEYALKNEYEITGYYADEGISARKSMRIRKELQRLLKDVQQDRIDMILVTKLDRWFRNIKDYQITQEILEAHHCCWKTIFESYDSSTANGQMVINIMLSVNQAESDRTSERIKAVFDYKRANGELISSRMLPYGYIAAKGHPQKDPETKELVQDAFEQYFTSCSIRSVSRFLHDKYGNHAPSDSIIERFFKNEKYAGRCGANHSFCEPYITYNQFLLIQKLKEHHTHTGSHNDTYIFSSLIQCPVCRKHCTGFRRKYQRKDGGCSIYIRYRCSGKYNCHFGATPSEKQVEAYMISCIFPLIADAFHLTTRKKDTKSLARTKKSAESEMKRLNALFLKGRIKEEEYEWQYQILEKSLSDDHALHSHADNCPDNWKSLYNSLDKAHKNAFWKSCIESIYINAETHQISGFCFL